MADAAWLQIGVTTSHAALAEAVLERYGALAVTLLDASQDLTVAGGPGEHPDFAATRALGLFTDTAPSEPIATALREVLGDARDIAAEILENEDWASRWLAEHPPLCFGDRLWVAPHAAPVDRGDAARVIRLDPGLAFGTGTHPTTALCLEWLARQPLAGTWVLDYGCGSGILAIAAARLGAAHVSAVDTDAQAIRATRENAARNALADRIDTPPIEALSNQAFDIVLANILAGPLIALAPALTALTRPGGELVLSGILKRQAESVGAAYSGAFVFAQGASQHDWVRLDARRNRL